MDFCHDCVFLILTANVRPRTGISQGVDRDLSLGSAIEILLGWIPYRARHRMARALSSDVLMN